MSSEAAIRASLSIRKGQLIYQSNPTAFVANVSAAKGPTPGLVTVSVAGTDISLALLTQPGLTWVQNLDDTNFVTLGVFDPLTNDYYPFMEFLPGECYVFRLSRYILEELSGTGTIANLGKTVRAKADYAPCQIRFDCFET